MEEYFLKLIQLFKYVASMVTESRAQIEKVCFRRRDRSKGVQNCYVDQGDEHL